MKTLLVQLSLLLFLTKEIFCQCFPSTLTYSRELSTGPSTVQYTSCPIGADGPKVYPLNSTSYDWWYFDAVSDDANEAITVAFYLASYEGFSFNNESLVDPLNVLVTGTFQDGSTSSVYLDANSVTIETIGDGASGDWVGTGARFQGAPDLSYYTVLFNNVTYGLKGSILLRSRGPGHYACSPLVGGKDEHALPHLGWANVLPAADAVVNMTLFGKQLKFRGNGYHDKNWGDQPVIPQFRSWYWGHGTFGDYQIVFAETIDPSGDRLPTGYVLQHGKVIGNTCSDSGMQIRPVGTPYPPTASSAAPDALTINMTLSDGSNLHAIVNKTVTQYASPFYDRWIGSIEGTVHGSTFNGSALWEQLISPITT